jgi:hypothetical protein
MDGSTSKINIDNLVYLGIHTTTQAHRWKDLFKKNPNAKCLGCGNRIRITNPISKLLYIKYYSHRYIPEVHWIFNFQLNPELPEAVEECKEYISSLSNKQKKEHIFPCCYQCWNISVNITKDYYTESVVEYYKNYSIQNPEYINWNNITFEECETDEQKRKKLEQYYTYISEWCNMIGYCYHTEDGLKYCSKKKGNCIHTNQELLLKKHQDKENKLILMET